MILQLPKVRQPSFKGPDSSDGYVSHRPSVENDGSCRKVISELTARRLMALQDRLLFRHKPDRTLL